MRRFKSLLFVAVAGASGVAAVFAAAGSAATETFKFEVVYSAQHPCTLEPVEGDTRVHMVVTTTENPDGSTRVRVHQHTHGQDLRGLVSGDGYVFNNGEDVITEADILGDSGRVVSRTEFIHQGETAALLESPGLDDFHQRLIFTFTPLAPPTMERDRSECR